MNALNATVINVEDDTKWQKRIEKRLKEYFIIPENQYHKVTSLREMHKILEDSKGPIIVLMDLQHNEKTVNYEGFEWIREHAMPHLFDNPQVSLFVISIYLNDEIRKVFDDLHIPEDHIYSKQYFDKKLPTLAQTIEDDVRRIHETTERPSHVDPYLRHQIVMTPNIATDRSAESLPDETVKEDTTAHWFPMLLEVKRSWWNPDDIPEFEVLSEVDNIISARGTIKALKVLQKHEAVYRIEASRPAEPLETLSSVPYVNANKRLYRKQEDSKIRIKDLSMRVNLSHDKIC